VLDTILADKVVGAGAELREQFTAEETLIESAFLLDRSVGRRHRSADALERAQWGEFSSWLVSDEKGLVISEGAGGKQLVEVLQGGTFPHVHDDQSFDLAMDRMGTAGLDLLPVVSRANIRHVEGIIVLRDILEAYGVARR